jgi:type IV pilus assembly protein PilN
MTKINLLPWREKAKAERLKQFYLLLGFGAGVGVIIIGIWFTILSSTISTQNERNNFLSKEIAALDIRLGEVKKLKEKKQNLTDRINVIVTLQEERSSTVRLTSWLMQYQRVSN